MKIKWALIFFLANVVFMHGQLRQKTMHVTADGTTSLILSVGGYTPLKDTIDYLNHQYGWRVSYEDPLYPDSQVEDIAVPSWRKNHYGERGFYVPKWTELKLRILRPIGQRGAQAEVLRELVQQYNQLQREDKFSVHIVSEARSAVVGNIRGVEVMGHARVLPQKLDRNGSEEMQLLTEECGGQMQMRIVVGTVPMNALAHVTIPARKTAVSCRDAFEALTEKTGDNFVYQVMEDITDGMFVVSIIPNHVIIHPTP
jgi:hypothetical protein